MQGANIAFRLSRTMGLNGILNFRGSGLDPAFNYDIDIGPDEYPKTLANLHHQKHPDQLAVARVRVCVLQ